MLLCATLLFWFAALQWARRPVVISAGYQVVDDTKPVGSALSAALLITGPTPGPTRSTVGQSQHSALGKFLRRREMGNETQNALGQSLLGDGRRSTESESAGAVSTDSGRDCRSAAALRQERAITALWFAKGLLDSVPSVALRQFVLQELQASPASQAVIFSVRMSFLLS